MTLSRRFEGQEIYRAPESEGYRLLPIRFTALDGNRYVVSNMAGEYRVLARTQLVNLVEHKLQPGTPLYDDLKSQHFIFDSDSQVAIPLLGLKYRTKLNRLSQFTGLHIFVASLRCDYSCQYCQVSRQTEDKAKYDMSRETADKALDLVFASPSPSIKIEFQGGEPLLNFPLIKHVVEQATLRNQVERRNLAFVITSNLTYLNDDVLDFCFEHDVYLSTSLDGPPVLHNKNRPRPGKDGHALTIAGIQTIQRRLGRDKVSALMTTTLSTLPKAREVIDSYVELGLTNVFLRPLSPYGFAVKTGHINRYNTMKWLEFYREGLDYIIDLNKGGYPIQETYAAIVLRKMLTPQEPGYVDLQSPAGIAIAAVVYNYDGDVYASDEARMLAEMNDPIFRLGNLHRHSYEEIFGNDTLMDALEQSITVSAPQCTDCAFLPYCGADPIYHYATQGDFVGNKAFSGFCQKNMGVFRDLIRRMEDDPYTKQLFRRWAFGC